MTATTTAPLDWRTRYARNLAITDLLVIVWAVFGTQLLVADPNGFGATVLGLERQVTLPATLLSLVLIVGWQLSLHLSETRDHRVIGTGSDEYRRILQAALRLFGAVAIIALLFKIDVARGYLLLTFPLGALALLFTRWLWRQWLVHQRYHGAYSSRLIVMGSAATALSLLTELRERPASGYTPAAVWVPSPREAERLGPVGIPVFSDGTPVVEVLEQVNADTVAVTGGWSTNNNTISELSWSLEPGRHHLILAPSLTNIAGPRLRTRPVSGLPLIHIETPRYQGAMRVGKRAFDLIAGSFAVVLLSPLLVALALTIRLSSEGPILFRQTRVGVQGETFTMLKFRSMVVDAEAQLAELQLELARSAGNDVLFKMKNDPRITPVGRFMRRFSLDELPQLFNVIDGTMSLVGPRPPLPAEVEQYEDHVHRRFYVKPGITGLWQVSGRSNLSWAESVRLDLSYVENWSLTNDLIILWRTFKAVVAREGAY